MGDEHAALEYLTRVFGFTERREARVGGTTPDGRLTIEATLQQSLEDLVRQRARTLGPDMSVAVVAVDNATGTAALIVPTVFAGTPNGPAAGPERKVMTPMRSGSPT